MAVETSSLIYQIAAQVMDLENSFGSQMMELGKGHEIHNDGDWAMASEMCNGWEQETDHENYNG